MFRSTALLLIASLGLVACGDLFPKEVEGSPAKVMNEFADLDIRELPGSPGTTAEAAGGVTPIFTTRRHGNRIEWVVTSGSQVAMTMIATFDPVDGGKRTLVTPSIERGPAPDEFVSPAFRDRGVTMGLFQSALQAELDEMNAPGWDPHCDELRDQLFATADGGLPNDVGLGPQAIAKLHKINRELLAAGCNPDKAPGAGEGFRRVESQMDDVPFGEGGSDGWATSEDGGWGN